MKISKQIHLLLLILFPLSLVAQSSVSNVRAIQEGSNVVLLYDLSKDAEISQVKIDIDGHSRVLPMSSLSGDVGKKVLRGKDRRIVYNVLGDYKDSLSSDNVCFVVEDVVLYHKGHAYVDLGLSVKWATCNVGASKPEDYGDYFAWGETKPKSDYSRSTYKWRKGDDNLTKYCTDGNYGTVDNRTQLALSDDAARANWGGSWRMPTSDETIELMDMCIWDWITQNGVKGYKVTSKVNGNSIFLPATGYFYSSSLYYPGSTGFYWSSSLCAGYPNGAMCVRFNPIGSGQVGWDFNTRSDGRSVRPVCL